MWSNPRRKVSCPGFDLIVPFDSSVSFSITFKHVHTFKGAHKNSLWLEKARPICPCIIEDVYDESLAYTQWSIINVCHSYLTSKSWNAMLIWSTHET